MRTRNPSRNRPTRQTIGAVGPVNAGVRGVTLTDGTTEAHPVREILFQGATVIDNDDGTAIVIVGPGEPGDLGETEGTSFAIFWVIDNAGDAITTGIKGDIQIPFACSITAWTILADQSGDITIDVWTDAYGNYPPTDADSITGGNEPEVSGDTDATGGVSGWSTSIAAGDTLRFNVDDVDAITKATLILTVERAAASSGGGAHTHAGTDITSGTVADARIDAAIARDSEVTSAVSAHTGDTSAAHAASAVSFTPNGSIAATDVQAAIQEVRDEATGGAVATDAIWDAKGDLAGGTGANTAARLAVGSNGQVLTADSGETTGMKWAAAGSAPRIVRGKIQGSDGSVLQGSGFTAARNGTGDYTITITSAFSAAPIVVGTVITTSAARWFTADTITTTSIHVYVTSTIGLADHDFTFVAIEE